jgi:microcompartment protein CcmK/EutM
MRIAEVIGTVTLSRCHPTFIGGTLKLVTPLTLAELKSGSHGKADTIVAGTTKAPISATKSRSAKAAKRLSRSDLTTNRSTPIARRS